MQGTLGIVLAFLVVFSVSLSSAKDCVCIQDNCGCCVQIKINDPKVDAPACVNITYDPQALTASLLVVLDNIVVYNKTVSLHNPDVCFGIPFIPLVDLCLQFSNLQWSADHLSGCLTVEVSVFSVTVDKIPAGCFNINVLAGQKQKPFQIRPNSGKGNHFLRRIAKTGL